VLIRRDTNNNNNKNKNLEFDRIAVWEN
jgi:hypothetical protein